MLKGTDLFFFSLAENLNFVQKAASRRKLKSLEKLNSHSEGFSSLKLTQFSS